MNVEPQQSGPQPADDTKPSGYRFAVACFKIIAFILVMGVGALYGVGVHKYFSELSASGVIEGSGQMLASFIVGAPLAIGVLVGFIAKKRRLAGYAGASALSTLSIALFVFAAGTWMKEGTICIVMAIPIFVVLAIIGAIIGVIVDSLGGSRGPKLLSIAVLMPAVMAPLENRLPHRQDRQETDRTIHIDASPETVWKHINYPIDIQPAELSGGFAYRIGVPYPIEARTIEGRVGGKRELRWQRGVTFEEVITSWEPNRHIAWEYKFQPGSFPPGSLDDHILIGGRYFNLEDTSYTLTPESGGTRLSIHVTTSVKTNFNWYAGMWARFLIGDTAESILRFYKHRSERSG